MGFAKLVGFISVSIAAISGMVPFLAMRQWYRYREQGYREQGIQHRMILVVIFFEFLKLLCFALLLIHVT